MDFLFGALVGLFVPSAWKAALWSYVKSKFTKAPATSASTNVAAKKTS